ncbi:hypothetical protein M2118_000266 [Aurantimicrobium minutum]|jgi:hypothetical protein|uniref:hypothetical protein n=1 Tax=Aurantimicrobium minutum TaxID=708131 RepID=UPI002476D6C6|nr:hypothetical protein [Aurantimicrobium minutum]MDH6277315.1 hypothetical protein [Aurantimicrobium minutum]
MSTPERVVPQWSVSAVLWICVLSIMAGFQTWRGAYVDGILFFSLVAMLILDRLTGGRILIMKKPIAATKLITLAITGTLGAVLVLAPRHSWVDLVVFVAIGVTVLLVAWEPAPDREQRPHAALLRSMWMWSMLAVAICVWEAAAFVLSVTMPGGNENYPTISVLLDPFVENVWGRLVFVGLWLAAGYGLLRFWRRS